MGEGGPPCGRPRNMPLLWSLMAFLSHCSYKHGAPNGACTSDRPPLHKSQIGCSWSVLAERGVVGFCFAACFRAALDQRLGLAHEHVREDPSVPRPTEVTVFELRLFRVGNLQTPV